jgi:hypothetical protein
METVDAPYQQEEERKRQKELTSEHNGKLKTPIGTLNVSIFATWYLPHR